MLPGVIMTTTLYIGKWLKQLKINNQNDKKNQKFDARRLQQNTFVCTLWPSLYNCYFISSSANFNLKFKLQLI